MSHIQNLHVSGFLSNPRIVSPRAYPFLSGHAQLPPQRVPRGQLGDLMLRPHGDEFQKPPFHPSLTPCWLKTEQRGLARLELRGEEGRGGGEEMRR